MKITLPYPPQANHLYAVVRGRKVLSKAGRLYKAKVADIVLNQSGTWTCRDVIVHIDVWRPRKSGDLDNVMKVILDSLTGSAWYDDKQVVEIHARRFDDKLNPRAEITVEAI